MKKLFVSLVLILGVASISFAQTNKAATTQTNKAAATATTTPAKKGPQIEFTKTVNDYGTIKKGANGECEFVFKNTGTEPLLLSNVSASCGCTTPKWTKEPIMPGQTGSIKVGYNTNLVGGFDKSITVVSNSGENDRVVLRIKGVVEQE